MTPVQRILPNAYADNVMMPRIARNDEQLPPARLISTTLTSAEEKQSSLNTLLLMCIGQFIDHDLAHVPVHMSGEMVFKFENAFTISGHF